MNYAKMITLYNHNHHNPLFMAVTFQLKCLPCAILSQL